MSYYASNTHGGGVISTIPSSHGVGGYDPISSSSSSSSSSLPPPSSSMTNYYTQSQSSTSSSSIPSSSTTSTSTSSQQPVIPSIHQHRLQQKQQQQMMMNTGGAATAVPMMYPSQSHTNYYTQSQSQPSATSPSLHQQSYPHQQHPTMMTQQQHHAYSYGSTSSMPMNTPIQHPTHLSQPPPPQQQQSYAPMHSPMSSGMIPYSDSVPMQMSHASHPSMMMPYSHHPPPPPFHSHPHPISSGHHLSQSISAPSLHSSLMTSQQSSSIQSTSTPTPSHQQSVASSSSSKSKSSSQNTTTTTSTPSIATIFSDLDSRFLLNLPDEELSSFERIMFQLQLAHWFYLDFYSDHNRSLPRFSYKTFCETYFKHIPTFKAHISKFEQVYASFNQYLNAVPVCGCILINPERTHCVMVRSYAGNVWGFPRGKLDANEDEITCAIREIDEEIGFDCRPWFKGYELIAPLTRQLSNESTSSNVSSTSSSILPTLQPSYIEAQSSSKVIRLYILLNVPNDSHFETKTRKEIGQISWIPIASLPSRGSNTNGGYTFSNMMQLFAPKIRTFMKRLKSGEITGYGAYDTKESQTSTQQQQQQQGGGGESKKSKQQQQQQQQQQSSPNQQQPSGALERKSSSTGTSRHKTTNSSSSSSRHADAKDQQTFASSSSSSSSSSNLVGGWSAEQMFAANERLGVITTVHEEKIQLPPHLDAQLDLALGRKPNASAANNASSTNTATTKVPTNTGGSGGGAQSSNSKASKKQNKKSSSTSLIPSSVADLPHSVSMPLNITNGSHSGNNTKSSSSSSYKSHIPASTQDLDFSHNPYVTLANLNLHQQSNTNTTSTTATTMNVNSSASSHTNTNKLESSMNGASIPIDATNTVDQVSSGNSKKEAKRRMPKLKQQQSAPSTNAPAATTTDSSASSSSVSQPSSSQSTPAKSIPQYRIQKRPTSAKNVNSITPASSSAPVTSNMTNQTTTTTTTATTTGHAPFQFNLASIMEPMT